MSKKYKLLLYIITIILISISLLLGGYSIYKYNKEKNSAEVIIADNLSFNYLNGKNIKVTKEKEEISFSVINDGENESMFHININKIKYDGKNVSYELYENNKLVVDKTNLNNNSSGAISSFITIAPGKTKSYKLIINNPDENTITFEIELTKSSDEDSNFSQVILNDNKVEKESKTKIGEEIAINNEGLIADVDDNGNTYYFRGNSTNNYVMFADKTWRIVRINGNGTVKLILDDVISESIIYESGYTDRLSSLNKISNSNVYKVLNEWYDSNLKDYDDYIFKYNFCVDTTKKGDTLDNYSRIYLVNEPTFNCLGTKNNLKIGLLTVDEIIYAGGSVNEANNYFYLYNESITSPSWTLSPSKDAIEGLYYFEFASNGNILSTSTGESSKALRPVINLKKDVEVNGSGTKEDPYTLK